MVVLMRSVPRILLGRTVHRQQHSGPQTTKRRNELISEGEYIDKNVSPGAKGEGKAVSDPNLIKYQTLWQHLGPLTTAVDAYGRTQAKRPWATQLGTSLVIYLLGDMAAQKIAGEDYDPWRTARHLTIGAMCSIPAYSW